MRRAPHSGPSGFLAEGVNAVLNAALISCLESPSTNLLVLRPGYKAGHSKFAMQSTAIGLEAVTHPRTVADTIAHSSHRREEPKNKLSFRDSFQGRSDRLADPDYRHL
jgi:hypothetical protein